MWVGRTGLSWRFHLLPFRPTWHCIAKRRWSGYGQVVRPQPTADIWREASEAARLKRLSLPFHGLSSARISRSRRHTCTREASVSRAVPVRGSVPEGLGHRVCGRGCGQRVWPGCSVLECGGRGRCVHLLDRWALRRGGAPALGEQLREGCGPRLVEGLGLRLGLGLGLVFGVVV